MILKETGKKERKEVRNLEKESTFSLLGKLLNFDEGVELNENTPPSLFLSLYYYLLCLLCII
jgi:hypothetical protein